MYSFVLLGIFALVSGALFTAVYFFRRFRTKDSKPRLCLIGIFTSGCILIYFILAIEILFFFFAVQSDSFGFTLASQRWNTRYWKPVNSFGFRDIEHDESEFLGKQIIFAVGDSLIAGYGIKDCKRRFSDLLQEKLGEEWVVLNIAKNGWSTPQEYEAITSYPHKPDIVILSYFINDIEDAAAKNRFPRPPLIKGPAGIIKPFVNRSYLVNFIYWRLYRFRNIDMGQIYWEYIEDCYSNERICETHRKELLDLINYTRDQDIKLIVVLFPHLGYIEESSFLTSKVVDFMNLNKVRVIDLADMLFSRDPRGLMVSLFDAHPNEKLNREIADLLYEEILSP